LITKFVVDAGAADTSGIVLDYQKRGDKRYNNYMYDDDNLYNDEFSNEPDNHHRNDHVTNMLGDVRIYGVKRYHSYARMDDKKCQCDDIEYENWMGRDWGGRGWSRTRARTT